jgi:hypothetical protein
MYKCKQCEFQSKTVSEIANHSKWFHKKLHPCECSKCHKQIKDIAGLKSHEKFCGIQKRKNAKIWICPKCNYEIKTRRESHLRYCNGLGTKRHRANKFGYGLDWAKNKTYEEIYGKEKADLMKKNMSNKLKGRCSGIGHTEEIERNRREKIREKILQRYENGWEVKCGRAKKIDYESPIAGKIKLDGSWELATAQYFDSIKINWKRNKQRFKYFNEIKNKVSTYCPDFLLVDDNKYIEVKGYTTELDRCKWKQFPYALEIWDKKKLKDMRLI